MTNDKVRVEITGDNTKLKKSFVDSERIVAKSSKKMADSIKVAGATMGVALGAVVTSQVLANTIKLADTYKNLESRLKLVTTSSANLVAIQSKLHEVSQKTRVSYKDTVDVFTRFARATKEAGVSQKDLLSVVESLNKAVIVSGASSTESSAALMQLSQGMASGVLRGQELNSVMEQTPRIAQMIADGLGVSIGKLREMGAAGELTSEKVINAIKSQRETVDSEYAGIEMTVGQAWTKLTNSLGGYLAEVDKGIGLTKTLASIMSGLADSFDKFSKNGQGSSSIEGLQTTLMSSITDANKLEKQWTDQAAASDELRQKLEEMTAGYGELFGLVEEKAGVFLYLEKTLAEQLYAVEGLDDGYGELITGLGAFAEKTEEATGKAKNLLTVMQEFELESLTEGLEAFFGSSLSDAGELVIKLDAKEAAKDIESAWEKLGKSLVSDLKSGLGDVIGDLLKGNSVDIAEAFESLLDDFADTIGDTIADKLVDELIGDWLDDRPKGTDGDPVTVSPDSEFKSLLESIESGTTSTSTSSSESAESGTDLLKLIKGVGSIYSGYQDWESGSKLLGGIKIAGGTVDTYSAITGEELSGLTKGISIAGNVATVGSGISKIAEGDAEVGDYITTALSAALLYKQVGGLEGITSLFSSSSAVGSSGTTAGLTGVTTTEGVTYVTGYTAPTVAAESGTTAGTTLGLSSSTIGLGAVAAIAATLIYSWGNRDTKKSNLIDTLSGASTGQEKQGTFIDDATASRTEELNSFIKRITESYVAQQKAAAAAGDAYAKLVLKIKDTSTSVESFVEAVTKKNISVEKATEIQKLAKEAYAGSSSATEKLMSALRGLGLSEENASKAATALISQLGKLGTAATASGTQVATTATHLLNLTSSIKGLSSTAASAASSVNSASGGSGRTMSAKAGAEGMYIPLAGGGLLHGGSGIRDDLYLGKIGGHHYLAQGGEFVVNPRMTSKHRGLIEDINNDRVSQVRMMAGGEEKTIHVHLHVDSKEVAEAILPNIDRFVTDKHNRGLMGRRVVPNHVSN